MATLVDKQSVIPSTEQPAWKALEAHYQRVRTIHPRDLVSEDPNRGERTLIRLCRKSKETP